MEADGRISATLEKVKGFVEIYTPTLSWDKYFQIVLTDFYPIASLPVSPVRMRIHSSMGRTNILPRPLSPSFLATVVMASTVGSTNSSLTAISNLTFFNRVISWEIPRYTSWTGNSFPCPLALVTVNLYIPFFNNSSWVKYQFSH